MYRASSRLHNTTLRVLNSKNVSGEYPRIFETIIPLSVKTAEASDYDATVNTIKQKYGYGGYFEVYNLLTKELLSYVE